MLLDILLMPPVDRIWASFLRQGEKEKERIGKK
jgi:hypothetical protein